MCLAQANAFMSIHLQCMLITPKMYAGFSVKYVKYYFCMQDVVAGQEYIICKYSKTQFVPCAWHKQITACQLVCSWLLFLR